MMAIFPKTPLFGPLLLLLIVVANNSCLAMMLRKMNSMTGGRLNSLAFMEPIPESQGPAGRLEQRGIQLGLSREDLPLIEYEEKWETKVYGYGKKLAQYQMQLKFGMKNRKYQVIRNALEIAMAYDDVLTIIYPSLVYLLKEYKDYYDQQKRVAPKMKKQLKKLRDQKVMLDRYEEFYSEIRDFFTNYNEWKAFIDNVELSIKKITSHWNLIEHGENGRIALIDMYDEIDRVKNTYYRGHFLRLFELRHNRYIEKADAEIRKHGARIATNSVHVPLEFDNLPSSIAGGSNLVIPERRGPPPKSLEPGQSGGPRTRNDARVEEIAASEQSSHVSRGNPAAPAAATQNRTNLAPSLILSSSSAGHKKPPNSLIVPNQKGRGGGVLQQSLLGEKDADHVEVETIGSSTASVGTPQRVYLHNEEEDGDNGGYGKIYTHQWVNSTGALKYPTKSLLSNRAASSIASSVMESASQKSGSVVSLLEQEQQQQKANSLLSNKQQQPKKVISLLKSGGGGDSTGSSPASGKVPSLLTREAGAFGGGLEGNSIHGGEKIQSLLSQGSSGKKGAVISLLHEDTTTKSGSGGKVVSLLSADYQRPAPVHQQKADSLLSSQGSRHHHSDATAENGGKMTQNANSLLIQADHHSQSKGSGRAGVNSLLSKDGDDADVSWPQTQHQHGFSHQKAPSSVHSLLSSDVGKVDSIVSNAVIDENPSAKLWVPMGYVSSERTDYGPYQYTMENGDLYEVGSNEQIAFVHGEHQELLTQPPFPGQENMGLWTPPDYYTSERNEEGVYEYTMEDDSMYQVISNDHIRYKVDGKDWVTLD